MSTNSTPWSSCEKSRKNCHSLPSSNNRNCHSLPIRVPSISAPNIPPPPPLEAQQTEQRGYGPRRGTNYQGPQNKYLQFINLAEPVNGLTVACRRVRCTECGGHFFCADADGYCRLRHYTKHAAVYHAKTKRFHFKSKLLDEEFLFIDDAQEDDDFTYFKQLITEKSRELQMESQIRRARLFCGV